MQDFISSTESSTSLALDVRMEAFLPASQKIKLLSSTVGLKNLQCANTSRSLKNSQVCRAPGRKEVGILSKLLREAIEI